MVSKSVLNTCEQHSSKMDYSLETKDCKYSKLTNFCVHMLVYCCL